jgi:hypothetical protein
MPNVFDQFDTPKSTGNVFDKFDQQAPSSTPAQRMTTEFLNVGPAASQGVTPDISQHAPNLVSADTFESDSGEILYRDPQSGKLVPTNSSTQVAIRDPADNRVKIFARTPDTAESRAVGVSRILAQGLATGAPTARPGIPTPSAASIMPKASDVFQHRSLTIGHSRE